MHKTFIENAKKLEGKKIKKVYWMDEDTAMYYGWDFRPPVLKLEGGILLFPASDDECNEGGAIMGGSETEDYTLPVERSC